MNAEVMGTVHAFVHHEVSRFYNSALTGLKDHRTDGQFRRSAPLQDFDIGLFFESEFAISLIGNLNRKLAGLPKLDISVIDLVLIDCDGGRSASTPIISREQDRCKQQQSASQGNEKPWEVPSLILFLISLIPFRH
jgi:hypothetical protein